MRLQQPEVAETTDKQHPVMIYSDGEFTETQISDDELLEYYNRARVSSDTQVYVCEQHPTSYSTQHIKESIRLEQAYSADDYSVEDTTYVVLLNKLSKVEGQLTLRFLVTSKIDIRSVALELSKHDVATLTSLLQLLPNHNKLQQIISTLNDRKIKPGRSIYKRVKRRALEYLKDLNPDDYNSILTVHSLWNELLADYPMLTLARGKLNKYTLKRVADYIKLVDSK